MTVFEQILEKIKNKISLGQLCKITIQPYC